MPTPEKVAQIKAGIERRLLRERERRFWDRFINRDEINAYKRAWGKRRTASRIEQKRLEREAKQRAKNEALLEKYARREAALRPKPVPAKSFLAPNLEGRETVALEKLIACLRARRVRTKANRLWKKRWAERYPDKARAQRRRRDARRVRNPVFAARKREWHRVWLRESRKDPAIRLRKNLGDRLRAALKGRIKAGSTVALLGCSPTDAKVHIERQFSRGMSWANWGKKWEVDHIRPLAGFDLSDPEQQRQACHFTNLRPFGAKQNASKGAKAVYLI